MPRGSGPGKNAMRETLREEVTIFYEQKRRGYQITDYWDYLSQSNAEAVFYARYRGRIGSVWLSENGLRESEWTLPDWETNEDQASISPNNALKLINSKDGTTVDQVYVHPYKTSFRRARMHFNAYLPNPATLPAGAALIVGFETLGQGGFSSSFLLIESGQARLRHAGYTETELLRNHTVITINNPDAWSTYVLDYDPPYLRLWQPSVGGTTPDQLSGEVAIRPTSLDYVQPFFANESSVVVSNFKIGAWSCWEHHRRLDTMEQILWEAETVPDTGTNSGIVETLGVDKKCFYLLSDQSATVGAGNEGMFLQVWDPVNSAYETVTSISVTANELASIETYRAARRMRIFFVPTAEAAVDLWAVVE